MRTRAFKLILILAAALRLALLASAWNATGRLTAPDTRDYVELSDNLARHAAFERDGQPEIFRTPGYPLLLAPGVLMESGWERVAAILQILLDVVLVYMVFLLGSMLCGDRAGLWAAGFQAVSAAAAVASVRILYDGLFAAVLTLTVLLLVHHLKTGARWTLLWAAVSAGLACYVRPVGQAFIAVAVVALLLGEKRWRRAGTFACVAAAVLAPWVARNAIVAGAGGCASVREEAAFRFQGPAVIAEVENISLDAARQTLRDRLERAVGDRDPSAGELARLKLRIGMEPVREHPGTYLAQHLRGDLAVWLPAATDVLEIAGITAGGAGTLEVWRREGIVAAVRHYFRGEMWAIWLCVPIALLLLVKLTLVLVCAARHLRLRMPAWNWLIFLTVLALTLLAGPAGHPRFRVPITPLLSVCAAAGAVMLMRGRRGPASDPPHHHR